jgi:signal transduction histidine kinase
MSILAHDLRSPFNVFLGLSELLMQNIRKYKIDEIENLISEINKSAQNTFGLLEDLLKWARMQSGKIPFVPQKMNFAEICRDFLEIFRTQAKSKNITINCISADEINIFADPDMIKAIFRNIITNALKFTYNGGQIDICAEKSNTYATFNISDNGIGIKPESLKKLFNISQITSTPGTAEETGSGLGLVLCKEFVEKHGGKIWVESEFDKGSKFKFTIPLSL